MVRRLSDETKVLVRPIQPNDKPLLVAGLKRLSPESIQRRFLSPKPSFSASELRYLTEVDGHRHAAFVIQPVDDLGELIGVGRFVRHADQPEAAEAAIVVADCWQRRGAGSLLAELLAAKARREGIRRFTATMQADNVPAHRLMQKLTAQLDQRHDGSIDELVVDLAA
jgi:protein lysine acetyltransferase